MKNFILKLLIFGLLLGTSIPCFANEKTDLKPACGFVRVTTNMLGYNFIARHIAQKVIKDSLNKSVAGEYKVKVDSFSGVDLKKGKFKGLTIEGKNLCIDNEVYFSRLYMNTTSDFNYVDYRKDPIEFKTDLPMDYVVEITEDDINNSVTGKRTYSNELFSMYPLLKIEQLKFKITDDKIRVSTGIKFPFCKPIKISMSTKLKVEDGKIVFTDVSSNQEQKEITEKLITLLNNYSFIENIKLNLFDGTNTTMAVKNVKVMDKKIYINGKIIIKKA